MFLNTVHCAEKKVNEPSNESRSTSASSMTTRRIPLDIYVFFILIYLFTANFVPHETERRKKISQNEMKLKMLKTIFLFNHSLISVYIFLRV